MNTFAPKPAAGEIHADEPRATERTLILSATEDGWSLVGTSGEVAFRGAGRAGRQQCLEFAREHGVLWVRTSVQRFS